MFSQIFSKLLRIIWSFNKFFKPPKCAHYLASGPNVNLEPIIQKEGECAVKGTCNWRNLQEMTTQLERIVMFHLRADWTVSDSMARPVISTHAKALQSVKTNYKLKKDLLCRQNKTSMVNFVSHSATKQN